MYKTKKALLRRGLIAEGSVLCGDVMWCHGNMVKFGKVSEVPQMQISL